MGPPKMAGSRGGPRGAAGGWPKMAYMEQNGPRWSQGCLYGSNLFLFTIASLLLLVVACAAAVAGCVVALFCCCCWLAAAVLTNARASLLDPQPMRRLRSEAPPAPTPSALCSISCLGARLPPGPLNVG